MASGKPMRGRTSVRTLFLSDIHLGFRHARAGELNEFLHGIEAERIVLVGDIIDALSLARRAFWTAAHTPVVRTLLARQRAGTLYCNTGDWVESCTALSENARGQLELLRWPDPRSAPLRSAAPPLADAA